jgi:hypothetical protein
VPDKHVFSVHSQQVLYSSIHHTRIIHSHTHTLTHACIIHSYNHTLMHSCTHALSRWASSAVTVLTAHCTHCTLYSLHSLHTVLTAHCTHCTLYSLHTVLTTHCTQDNSFVSLASESITEMDLWVSSLCTIGKVHYIRYTLHSPYTHYTLHDRYSTLYSLYSLYTALTIHSPYAVHRSGGRRQSPSARRGQ